MDTNNMHIHRFRETVVPPTCKSNGYTLYTCDCGYEYETNFTPVAAHSFQAVDATAATCTQGGRMTLVCKGCGETRMRNIPPLGHAYGQWVAKAYPTCQTPGTQVRSCRRCGAVEERGVAPLGHKCVPGTERRFDGDIVEYFCGNCGQTIRRMPREAQLEYEPKRYPATRTMLIIVAFVALLRLMLCVVVDLQPGHSVTWYGYSFAVVALVWNICFAFQTNKIKQNVRYSRLLGAAMATHGLQRCVSLVANIIDTFARNSKYMDADQILQMLTGTILVGVVSTVFFVFLSILFLRGGEKKTWVFIVVLCCTVISVMFTSFGFMTQLAFQIRYIQEGWLNVWSLVLSGASYTSNALTLVGLTMLIAPRKKAKKTYVEVVSASPLAH